MALFKSKVAKSLGIKPIRKWHTPFMQLDFSLGKGFAEGVWIEVFGPEGLGKTTLTLHSASIYLNENPDSYLLFLDVEKALDPEAIKKFSYQENIRVDYKTGYLYINDKERGQVLEPDTYEQIDEITGDFIKFCSGEKLKGLIVWDSLVSAVSQKIQDTGSEKLAYKATSIQAYIEKYISDFHKTPITLLVINQIRDKIIGFVMGQDKSLGGMVDDTYHVPGGKAHKFYSFQSLMLISGKKWKYGSSSDKIAGKVIKIVPTKNKQAPDGRRVDLVKIDDYGFSSLVSLLEFLKTQGLLSGTMAGIKFSESSKLGKIYPKKIRLETFVDNLLENEEVFNTFYEICFYALSLYYKEQSRLYRYDKEEQKRTLKLDIEKLKKFLEGINTNSAPPDELFGNNSKPDVKTDVKK